MVLSMLSQVLLKLGVSLWMVQAVKAGEVEVVDALEMADYEAEWPEVRDANRFEY